MHFRPYEPLDMSTDLWRELCPIEIPINILIPSQKNLTDLNLIKGHSFCGDEFIHIVYYKGGFWIVDGHNRVSERLKEGYETIYARLKFK